MQNKLLSVGEVAKLLGVSIDTLRRWDTSGRLPSIRSGPKGHRYYNQLDIDQYLQKIDAIARNWTEAIQPQEPNSDMYCQTRDTFQARLEILESKLSKTLPIETVSLVTAISGEIGNNSFDHNLGNWPDIPGIFFSYSLREQKVVLADRGLGVLATLKRVRANLATSSEALKVAFTETISGRFPEARGNGLKFVRSIIVKNPFSLYFQTQDAMLNLKQGDSELLVELADKTIHGCLAIIEFEEQT